MEVEAKLSSAQVIDVTLIENTGRVIFGVTVTMKNGDDKTVTYQIVGEDEADINHQKISVTSPVARALIGKYEGDEVEVHTPDGVIAYEIIEVTHA
jgi:transcription elongation factor GreA